MGKTQSTALSSHHTRQHRLPRSRLSGTAHGTIGQRHRGRSRIAIPASASPCVFSHARAASRTLAALSTASQAAEAASSPLPFPSRVCASWCDALPIDDAAVASHVPHGKLDSTVRPVWSPRRAAGAAEPHGVVGLSALAPGAVASALALARPGGSGTARGDERSVADLGLDLVERLLRIAEEHVGVGLRGRHGRAGGA